jgi:GT2 family glycosyltransferase
MEWIILDDGTESVEDLFAEASKTIPNIRYIKQDERTLIGAKRNTLMTHAKGDIFVWMDDDDFYSPDRVQHAVTSLQRYPRVQLAGSSLIYLYYFDNKKIYSFGPIHQKHGTNGTMAVRREYTRKHKYDETVTFAEEKSFLDEFIHDMVQLDPMKTMLVMCHANNTFDKRSIRDTSGNPVLRETSLKLKDFVRSAAHREFYLSLSNDSTI